MPKEEPQPLGDEGENEWGDNWYVPICLICHIPLAKFPLPPLKAQEAEDIHMKAIHLQPTEN